MQPPEAHDWSGLFAAASAETPPVPRVRQRNAAALALWRALRAEDLSAIEAALRQGASVHSTRNGQYPIEWAVKAGHWSAVEALLAHGAAFSQANHVPGYGIWIHLTERDNPEDAERLLQWGAPQEELLMDWWLIGGAVRLLDWQLARMTPQQVHQCIPRLARMGIEHSWWKCLAKGPSSLRQRVMQRWKIAHDGPWSLWRAMQELNDPALMYGWVTAILPLLKRDEVRAIGQWFKEGWGIPGVALMQTDRWLQMVLPAKPIDPGWMFAQAGAFKAVRWWRSDHALAQRMDEEGKAHPEQWWPLMGAGKAGRDLLQELGYLTPEWLALTNAEGQNGFEAFVIEANDRQMTRKEVAWLLTQAGEAVHRPSTCFQPHSNLYDILTYQSMAWVEHWEKGQTKKKARILAQEISRHIGKKPKVLGQTRL